VTSNDRTLEEQPSHPQLLSWITATTALLSVIGVALLALTHHPEAAAAVGAIGSTVAAFNAPGEIFRSRR
jgi:hypothetical protein